MNEIVMSALPKTWILDLDGTLVKHNGYKLDGFDSLLPDADQFLNNINDEDFVIIVTSRTSDYKDITEQFLKDNNIHFDHIIYDAPYGERILVNDNKPSGLKMAYSIPTNRDEMIKLNLSRNAEL